MFAALALSGAVPALAGDFGAFVSGATDYRVRGVSHSHRKPVLQGGVNYRSDGGWYASVWASTAEYVDNERRQDGVDLETQYWLGWERAFGGDWRVGGGLGLYRYPGARSIWDYDYRELHLTASYIGQYALALSYSDDTSGYYGGGFATNGIARSAAASARWALLERDDWHLDAGVGYYDLSDVFGDGYWYWSAAVSHQRRRWQIRLGSYGTDGAGRRLYNEGIAATTLLLSVTLDLL